MPHQTFARIGILVIAALPMTACIGGRSPSVQFYNLSATEAGLTPGTTESGPAISVGPVIFPKSLRRAQLLIRTGPNSVELDEFHRWSGSLESDFVDVLGTNLGALLGTQRVAMYPAEAMFPTDYRISLDVDRFDGAPGGTLVLSARWTVTAIETMSAAAVRHSMIQQPVAGDTMEALVRAHDAALAQLSRQIAEQISAL